MVLSIHKMTSTPVKTLQMTTRDGGTKSNGCYNFAKIKSFNYSLFVNLIRW